MLRRFYDWLTKGHGSTRPLGLFRIMLVILLWTRFAGDLALWNATDMVTAVSGLGLLLLGALALIGWQTRRVMALLATLMVVVYFHLGINQNYIPFTHHHTYLLMVCTAITAIGPCERSFSLDAWQASNADRPFTEFGSLAPNRLMIVQLAAIYLWAAVDKTNWVFLSGLRLDQILHLHYFDSPFRSFLLWPPLILALSAAVVITEYFLAIGVFVKRFLPAVLIVGLIVHGGFFWLLPVQTFSATMLAMYIFLFNPRSVHRTCHVLLANAAHREPRSYIP